MIWKGIKVNINNYQSVFRGYPKGTLEVIRGAILDDTNLGDFIDLYGKDCHLLFEIKVSLDSGLDSDLIFSILKGSSGSFDVLNKVVNIKSRGFNIKPLLRYFNIGLSVSHINYILNWYERGFSLERYDFSILPSSLLEIFDYGLSLNYPMYIFNNGVQYEEGYIKACLKILSNKKSVDMFLDGSWYIDVLEMLSGYSKSKHYDKLLEYVTKNITTSMLEELYHCCRIGMKLDEVSKINDDGLYVYEPVKVRIIREAFLKGYDYKKLMNPELSVLDMSTMLNTMIISPNKKISGRL